MKNDRFIVFLVIALVSIASLVGVSYLSDDGIEEELVSNIKTIGDYILYSKPDQALIMEIGDVKITREQLKLSKSIAKDKSDIAAYESLIRSTVKGLVAQDEGIELTREEVFKYIEQLQKNYNENPNSKEVLNQYFESMNLKEGEFWILNETYKVYYDFLLDSKLRRSLGEKIVQAKGNQYNYEELRQLVDEELNRLIDLKLSTVNIKYYK
ncbi:hypothetical protein [Serpentinicella alkaliphila]|uniref:SurA-like protein n=1 Tax=Serpentinicella alkaliphila TaxID=1734049 RepID=A0A4R2TEE0_9FIRM|nr:hypothetical protein [Serpentinicella alkaliphila]QUH26236.1 hypothetical protein HZR23_11195 [Serpentinicella alkaliphila]TCQ01698.1 hypothetical protein EDD79_102439 [Serpentinicella alkaliphila]